MPQPSASDRRQSVRTGVVWDGVRRLLEDDGGSGEQARIVDVGGGTGGFAVPLAELGHRVQVIDPSPDALASLDRRARERGVADLVTGQQGDLSDLSSLVEEADLVLCHGVLEMVDDPAASLAAIAGVLRPGGHLSLLVAQRHAAVVARAMAGHFQAARELLDGDSTTVSTGRGGRRFTHDELVDLLVAAGPAAVVGPGRAGLRRPRARQPPRPRARRDRGPGRARAGRRHTTGVPPARGAAARHRPPLTRPARRGAR